MLFEHHIPCALDVGNRVHITMLQIDDFMGMESRDRMHALIGHNSPLTLYPAPTFSYSLPQGGVAESVLGGSWETCSDDEP